MYTHLHANKRAINKGMDIKLKPESNCGKAKHGTDLVCCCIRSQARCCVPESVEVLCDLHVVPAESVSLLLIHGGRHRVVIARVSEGRKVEQQMRWRTLLRSAVRGLHRIVHTIVHETNFIN